MRKSYETSCDSAGSCRAVSAAATNENGIDMSLNPNVAALRPSKTMMLSDLASSLRESGVDIISFAAGEPDFDTPEEIIGAGIEALRCSSLPSVQYKKFQLSRNTAVVALLICQSYEITSTCETKRADLDAGPGAHTTLPTWALLPSERLS
jgi:aspartate/glutamate/aspartate-prephenate aminotransferase